MSCSILVCPERIDDTWVSTIDTLSDTLLIDLSVAFVVVKNVATPTIRAEPIAIAKVIVM